VTGRRVSLDACAEIVRRGDPERFAATMAAPLAARRVMLPIYAFNVEVARAPWVSPEAMIGELRLQWWRDALEEIAHGAEPRRHEVVTPLSEALSPNLAAKLDALVAARRWDLYSEPFEDDAHFLEYTERTGGVLTESVAAALSAPTDSLSDFRSVGQSSAIAKFFVASAELTARGKQVFVGDPKAFVERHARGAWSRLTSVLPKVKRHPAAFETFAAEFLLKRALIDPQSVLDGTLQASQFRTRFRLLRASLGV